jgi:hypothetical protein
MGAGRASALCVLPCKPHHVFASVRGDVVASEASGRRRHAAASRPVKIHCVIEKGDLPQGDNPASLKRKRRMGSVEVHAAPHWQCIPSIPFRSSKPQK